MQDMSKYGLRTRPCVLCGKEYTPHHVAQKYCSQECFRQHFFFHNRKYQADWARNKRATRGDEVRQYHRNHRRRVQVAWGYVNDRSQGGHGGLKGELYALGALRAFGFENIYHLNALFSSFPFDIKANKDGKLCLIQVTMRTHNRQGRHRILAEILGADMYVFFVKPDLSKGILKNVNDRNSVELSLTEVLA